MRGVRPDADVEPGSLLVAAPSLTDSNFRRTVVYIIDHRDEGSLGVVLNRPSEVAVHDVLPAWGPHVSRPQAVYIGGPVLAALMVGGWFLVRGRINSEAFDDEASRMS